MIKKTIIGTEVKRNELLKLVKKKGILVEKMPKGTSFIFDKREQYKTDLGAVTVKNIFGNITNVYLVYEDFDGSIKYYDYPQKNARLLWYISKSSCRKEVKI